MGGDLSQRQRQILEFIVKFTAEHDYPPTIREIGTNVGISSTSVVNYNLNKLEGMELLTREREVSRGLSLNRGALAGAGVNATAAPAPAPILKMENGRRNGRKERADRFSVPLLGYIAAASRSAWNRWTRRMRKSSSRWQVICWAHGRISLRCACAGIR